MGGLAALAGTVKTGLVAFASADGIHWKKLRAELHVGLEKLRTELIERIEQGFRSQTWKLIGALIASQSTTIAAIALFVR